VHIEDTRRGAMYREKTMGMDKKTYR
jgi:hypothetical protein